MSSKDNVIFKYIAGHTQQFVLLLRLSWF